MRKFLAKRALDTFEKRYNYNVDYMRRMLHNSPAGFFKFIKVTDAALHREITPVDAWYAAKIVGAVAEDCGACVQLDVDMARKAGMETAQIEAVLKRNCAAMNEEAALGFHFADAIIRKLPSSDEVRDSVRAQWGEAGIIELTLSAQFARLFPMIKMGLGFSKTCRRIEIDAGAVDVVKEAA